MAYYSKYTGKELEERLDRINDIPALINKLFLDKEYLTELEVKCLIKEMIPTFYEGIPIDNKTIYWENGVLKSLGTGEGGGGCDCPELWEVKEANGQQYLYSRLPIATQGGITMYANGGGINIPSIYAGIPVDGTTITKREDGTLMVNPNIELGGASNWDELEGKPSWITNSKPKYNYNEIEGTPDLSKYVLNEDIENLVTLNTDQIISGYKNFEKGIAINGLSITNTKDDVVYLDANLVVRGGIVMYADDTVDVPNLIDSLPKASYEVPGLAAFDSTYFVVDTNGKVTLIPDNVGLNEEQLNNYLSTNNYAKKSDIPSLNGYATQTWVTSEIESLINGAPAAYDTLKEIADVLQGNVNSIGDIITTLGTKADKATTLSGYGITDAYTKFNVDNLLSKYVTIAGTEDVTGIHNFVNGLKIGGLNLSKSQDDVVYLDANLVVRGGITMYGEGTVDVGTIYDGLPIDGSTIYWENGVLKSLGGGGTADSVAWDNITDKPSWIGDTKPSYTIGEMSNVGSWADSVADVDRIMYQAAGSSMWVAKSLSSIGGGGGVSGDYLLLSGGTLTLPNRRGLIINRTDENKPVIAFYNSSTSDYNYLGFNGDTPIVMKGNGSNYPILHTDNYSSYALPLTGGKLKSSDSPLIIERTDHNSPYVAFMYNNSFVGGIGVLEGDTAFYNPSVSSWQKIWHSGNDGSGSGLDADLLDGVHFTKTYSSVSQIDFSSIMWKANGAIGETGFGSLGYAALLNVGDDISRGWQVWNNRSDHRLYWRAAKADLSGWGDIHVIIDNYNIKDYNAGSATKLQTARTIWGQSFDGTGNVSGDFVSGAIHIHRANEINSFIDYSAGTAAALHLQYRSSGNITICNGGGNVGIGTTSPSSKLQVSGDILVTGKLKWASEDHYYIGFGSDNSANYKWWYGHRFFSRDEERMVITATGEVGIGITNPAYKLDIVGHCRSEFMYFFNKDWNGNAGYIGRGSTSNNRIILYAASDDVYIYSKGVLSTIFSGANMLVQGGITMYSDARKKTILNHVELSLKQIAEAPLIEHYYNSDDKRTTHVGSIAQYWASMNDWFCKLDSEGYYTMEIQNAALASAISIARELDRYETKTDKTIKQLKKRICQLEEELERLKSA